MYVGISMDSMVCVEKSIKLLYVLRKDNGSQVLMMSVHSLKVQGYIKLICNGNLSPKAPSHVKLIIANNYRYHRNCTKSRWQNSSGFISVYTHS